MQPLPRKTLSTGCRAYGDRMNLTFLGGASGIGASCIALQFDDRWVLVDAGIRMDPNADRLPDLAFLQNKNLAAIFVTHAHADHIGAIPLVHQAFPTVPIYASRGTMHLMAVMLRDALQVMAKRASTEMEVPLYDETLVSATLHSLLPLPMSATTTIAALPDVTIHTARAGHVAGAISIGFDAPQGRVIISGDLSMTPQRTLQGAELPALQHPDVLVLESTYGTRMHPNRRAEEDRLAQAVAEGIERGGIVLIPAFALGRAQEVLLILQHAQRQGRIPEFPIWVDGLIRTVCTTYTAIPEALSPALQRQIRKGYPPFFTGMVRAVSDARHRERILQGGPACIVSSSGMLTGGPSAFYAAAIAENPSASILITGYQDEESPGRRLLALADNQGGTLELNDRTLNVRCHFDRYNLSAHADGGELAAFVAAIKPRTVALVHGDADARAAMAQRLTRLARVVVPEDGEPLTIEAKKRKTARTTSTEKQPAAQPESPPAPLAETLHDLTVDTLARLWMMVADQSEAQVVSLRELTLVWYGPTAGETEQTQLERVLDQQQPFFVPIPDLPGMVRVRTASEMAEAQQTWNDAEPAVWPGSLLLLHVYGEKLLPAICTDMRADALWVRLPAGDGNRTRFPRSTIVEKIGAWSSYPLDNVSDARRELATLFRNAQRWQRQQSIRMLVQQLDPDCTYRFDELADLMGLQPDDLVSRLALALSLNETPRLIQHQPATWEGLYFFQPSHYTLQPGWQQALAEGAGETRPDQMWIVSVVERHLGQPADLYRRSVNPDSGEVVLYFHFPDVARERYASAIEAASAETGFPINIAPQPHQGELTRVAHTILPAGLTPTKTGIYHDRRIVRLRCSGHASTAVLEEAVNQFQQQTGWVLELSLEDGHEPGTTLVSTHTASAVSAQVATAPSSTTMLDMNTATALARAALRDDTGCYKISADQARSTLMVRFHFPDVARERYADRLAAVAQQTGWYVTVYPEPHQGELEAQVRRVLPAGLEALGAPSLYRQDHQVVVRCRGTADAEAIQGAERAFRQETGWNLVIRLG